MFDNNNKSLSVSILVMDLILLFVAFFAAKWWVFEWKSPNVLNYSILFIGWAITWTVIGLTKGLYDIPRIIFFHKVLSKNISALLIFCFFSTGLIFFWKESDFSRRFILNTLNIFFGGILLARIFLVSWLKATRRNGNKQKNIVLVGINANISKLIRQVYTNKEYGFNILGLFTEATIKGRYQEYYKGKLEDVIHFLDENSTDELIISLPHSHSDLTKALFSYADNHMIRVRVIPEFSEYLSQVFTIDYVRNVPVMKLRKEPLQNISNRIIKRLFDIVFSLGVTLLVFSWLFPIIAIIIKCTSKGPVFFKQERTGKDGKSFNCLKFRSMTVNADSDSKQATKGDQRITKFGAFMRKTSIDELPQILNVLFNHMSLVGPRPHMLKHTDEYKGVVDKFMVRHFAKPGVTGWAQINGFRGETKQVQDMANRAEADIWYIENWSFILDLRIIFKTAWTMIKPHKNAY